MLQEADSEIITWNVTEVELASTPVTLRATIAKVDARCNSATARNVASCVQSFSSSFCSNEEVT